MQPRSSQPPNVPRWRADELVVVQAAIGEVQGVLAEGGIRSAVDPDVQAGRYRLLKLERPAQFEGDDLVLFALELLGDRQLDNKPLAQPNYIHGCPQMRGGQFVLPDPIPPPDVVFRPSPVGLGVRVLVLDTIYIAPPMLEDFVPSIGDDADITDANGDLVPSGGHSSFVVGQILRAAPGADILPPVPLLDNKGECDDMQLAAALITARAQQPHIVNLSLGCQTLDDRLPNALQDPIDDLAGDGAVIVAAAGNDDAPKPWFPAAYGTLQPAVYGVGAVVRVFEAWARAAYSNFGDWVRAVAPGMLEGPFPEWYAGPQPYEGWARWVGTSFATPLVSGAIAQLMSRDPSLDAPAAAEALLANSPVWWWGQAQEPDGGGDFGAAPVIDPPALWP
jgi:subtilisin family serine protease